MSIDPDLLIAAKMIHDECTRYSNCDCCTIKFLCSFTGIPSTWKIPDPPPEPIERQRIEWLRMLPDKEVLDAINRSPNKCLDCEYNDGDCVGYKSKTCFGGHMDWWHEVVSLEQFRKDVGLSNDTDS